MSGDTRTAYRRRAAETERTIDAAVAEVRAEQDARFAANVHRATHCAVCDVKVFKTRDPRKFVCSRCGRVLCGKHAWFYTDESNIAITRNARPKCADCWDGTA